jgi:hypothetical protein
MPLDERDAKFEKALSRHLRAECPDAETLAAYHERMLAPEELVEWKKHIAGCGACQEILAQIELTEQLALESDKAVPTLQARGMRSAAPAGAPPTVAKVSQFPGRWRKWSVPAGAIAAGLLVWLVVRDQDRTVLLPKNPAPAAAPKSVEAGKAEAVPRGDEALHAQSLDRNERTKALQEKEAKQKDLPVLTGALQGSRDRVLNRTRQANEERDDKLRANAKELDEKGRLPASDSGQVAVSSETASATAAPVDRTAVSGGAQNAAAPVPAPPPPVAPPAEEGKKKAEFGALRQQAANGNISTYKQDGYLADADAVTGLHLVRSPGGKTVWRIGRDGSILRANLRNQSGEWEAEVSGVTAELTSGAAPSDEVCWIVGREGTILRTTDGGNHWEKIRSPIVSDVAEITATDAKHAVIRASGSLMSYETTDGGATWRPIANP